MPDAPRAAVTITFVRPGPRALDWLERTITALKADDPLRPVTVIVPNFSAGRQVARYLAQRGGYLNVRTVRLQQLAALLAPEVTEWPTLTPVMEESAVRQAVQEAGGPLRAMIHHRSLQLALVQLFRELRRREVDAAHLRATLTDATAQAALDAYLRFRCLTAGYGDATAVRERAARCLAADTPPPALAELGPLVLLLPTRLDPVDTRLLAAASRWQPLRAAFPWFGDPQGRGDEPALDAATRLAAALALPPPAPPDTPATLPIEAEVRIIRAPDPAEEVREVLRRIMADLERGVPLYRVAVLYRQAEPYAALVRELLTLAELPWTALESRPLTESRAGRALLALFRLPEGAFAREAVMAWVDTAPELDDGMPPPTAWDRLTRAANVVRGVEAWRQRLGAYATEQEETARRREREGDDALAGAARRQAEQARRIAQIIEELAAALQPPADYSPWGTFVDWAEQLSRRFARAGAGWPADEQALAEDVRQALASLREADRFDAARGATLASFQAALQGVLEMRGRPVGRLGEGVLVGPVQAVTGLAFERVYLLGLTEGSFPPPPMIDPFFPPGATDPLGRRRQDQARERAAFLTALAAADGGLVTLSTPDAVGGRAAFPSPWLLEVASLQPGVSGPLHASDFRALDDASAPWLRIVRSAQDGVERAVAPADLEDRRLAEAAAWSRAGRPLRQHALARRADLPLGAALTLLAARDAPAFTCFDGNLSALAGRSRRIVRLLEGAHPISASAVETWAACPYRYFLGHVLRIEPTLRPEESWSIDPLVRGSLIHAVLEEFFRTLADQGRPRGAEPYGEEDFALLETIARRHFARAQARGATGHPLGWELACAVILSDLHAFLLEDARWRAEQQVRPRYFEQPFGTNDPGAWPPLVFELDGARLRFRGYIDRVDISDDGRRCYVFDYKTGSVDDSYAALQDDPVGGGQRLQLALYAEAARQQLSADAAIGGAYWFVSSSTFERRALPDDAERIQRRLRAVLASVAEGIRSGVFPPVPGQERENSFANCSRCDFERVCPPIRDEFWERKQHDPCCAPYLRLSTPPETMA